MNLEKRFVGKVMRENITFFYSNKVLHIKKRMLGNMEEKIAKELQKEIRVLLGNVIRAEYYIRKQKYYFAMKCNTQVMNNIEECLLLIINHLEAINGERPFIECENIITLLKNLQDSQEKSNYVLLADIYELQMIPFLTSVEERISTILGVYIDEKLLLENIRVLYNKNPQVLFSLFSEDWINKVYNENKITSTDLEDITERVNVLLEREYVVENTSSGYLTLGIIKDMQCIYFHTNGQIIKESLSLAEEWLGQDKLSYFFYGLGFLYPYVEMLEMNQNMSLTVYESNKELLFLAIIFAPLYRLYEKNQFELIYDPLMKKISQKRLSISKDEGFYIFYPAIMGIKKETIRTKMYEYFLEESSVREQTMLLNGNFRVNTKESYFSIEELKSSFLDRDVVIVAAGPSLDKNIEEIKRNQDKVLILAVGTVFQKLLNAGIKPDFVIIIDAGEMVYNQIQGCDNLGVPLIFLSTVYSRIVKDYSGEKYLICQKGMEEAEILAKQKGWMIVETGGSVATTAFDLCLKLNVRKIIFVGLDLAFTNNIDHCSETLYQTEISTNTGVWVEGVNGEKVMTSKNLLLYKNWIEERYKRRKTDEKYIEVINATEGGALIYGIKNMRLKDAIEGEL